MSEPEEKWSRHHIICPHCGYERRAEACDGDCDEDEQEEECGECGKEFVRYASISITYHTKPKVQP